MRDKIACLILGAVLTVGAYEAHRAWKTRKPDVYIESMDNFHATVVFRWKGERLATYIPVIPQCLPSYTVQVHVWHQDLVEGPDHKDIFRYALEHQNQPLPWTATTFAGDELDEKNRNLDPEDLLPKKPARSGKD